jgi:hypothetical protein
VWHSPWDLAPQFGAGAAHYDVLPNSIESRRLIQRELRHHFVKQIAADRQKLFDVV